MKLFLIRLSIFLLVPIVGLFAIYILFIHTVNTIKIPPQTTTLLMGDSHIQSGLNDSLIPNSVNIAQASEHYFYTYNVLQKLLFNNPQVKRVILGVSYHSFSQFYDDYIPPGKKSDLLLSKYYLILDYESIKKINLVPYKLSKQILLNTFNTIKIGSSLKGHSFIGFFYKSSKSNLNDSTSKEAILRHFYKNDWKEQPFSETQLFYLSRIMQLCKSRGVELSLLNTPLQKKYLTGIPERFIANYYSSLNSIGVSKQLLDFHNYELSDSCFGDSDHLNIFGADTFSKIINTRLNNNQYINIPTSINDHK
jgi:hypothetical protein